MKAKEPQRRCILAGDELPASAMLRFVAGPGNHLVPDLAGKLPGRGVWITTDGALLSKSIEDGTLLKAASRGLKCQIDSDSVALTLIDQIEGGLVRACLNLIGLARAAGCLVAGFEKSRAALKSGNARLILLARDAGLDGRKKIDRLARVRAETGAKTGIMAIELLDCFDREQLGQAIGRDNTVHVVIINAGFANRIWDEALRLAAFRGKALRSFDPGRVIVGNERPEEALLEN